MSNMKIFAGSASGHLAKKICSYLGMPIGEVTVKRFKDGEKWIKFEENIRGRSVVIIQSTNQPHSNIFELFLMLDAARRASARRITAVIPYFGYGRQDRKDQPRVPITAKLMANLIWNAGADKVIVFDLHQEQIAAYFDIPVDHLYARPVFVEYFVKRYPDEIKNLAVVAPDAGAVGRARSFAKRLDNAPVVLLDKRRDGHNQSKVMNVVGKVRGKNVVIVDDMIDTGGTLVEGANALKKKGAKRIFAFSTHPVLSGKVVEKINNSFIDTVFVTDSINKKKLPHKFQIVSIANLLGETIRRGENNESVSSLF